MDAPKPDPVNTNDLRPGPIRNQVLSAELVERIEVVYDVIGPYLGMTLEQFEVGFMRDEHPESEVAIWCSITAAWIAYHEEHLNDEYLPDDEEKKIIAALIAISSGAEDPKDLNLPLDVAEKLLDCYDSLDDQP
jgi:hypothetical protein